MPDSEAWLERRRKYHEEWVKESINRGLDLGTVPWDGMVTVIISNRDSTDAVMTVLDIEHVGHNEKTADSAISHKTTTLPIFEVEKLIAKHLESKYDTQHEFSMEEQRKTND